MIRFKAIWPVLLITSSLGSAKVVDIVYQVTKIVPQRQNVGTLTIRLDDQGGFSYSEEVPSINPSSPYQMPVSGSKMIAFVGGYWLSITDNAIQKVMLVSKIAPGLSDLNGVVFLPWSLTPFPAATVKEGVVKAWIAGANQTYLVGVDGEVSHPSKVTIAVRPDGQPYPEHQDVKMSDWRQIQGRWAPGEIIAPALGSKDTLYQLSLAESKVTAGSLNMDALCKGVTEITFRGRHNDSQMGLASDPADFKSVIRQLESQSLKLDATYRPPIFQWSPLSRGVAALLVFAVGGFLVRSVIRLRSSSAGANQNSQKGFTIVELLVVISILCLLAALLTPVFFRAKRSAFEATAISNVSQIGRALSLYLADNDGGYVVRGDGGLPGDDRGWPQRVCLYIQPVVPHGSRGKALIDDLPKIFLDPGKPFKSQIGTSYKLSRVCGWGLSDDVSRARGVNGDGVMATQVPMKESQFINPSGTLVLAETWDYRARLGFPGDIELLSYFYDYSPGENGAMVGLDTVYGSGVPRVGDGLNDTPEQLQGALNIVLFGDFHAAPKKWPELAYSPKYWSVTGNSYP